MRFTGFIACAVVALDCAERATGAEQSIFAPGLEWIWLILAVYWAFASMRFLVGEGQ